MKKQRGILFLLVLTMLSGCNITVNDSSGNGTMSNSGNTNTSSSGEYNNYENIVYSDELFTDAPRETYKNSFTEENIPDYWPSYGVGDPFVYRYNGMYYLICSTSTINKETGIRGWKSKDLIHWEKCTGKGLKEGYISEDAQTYCAYAPEMTYINGKFYICESKHGEGHYILESDSPEGPFVTCVDNFGEQIDGSFFIDDDEKIYFLRANNNNISGSLLEYDYENKEFALEGEGSSAILKKVSSKTFQDTSIASWTEGPYMLKKDGIYYLTYTGPNVVSEAYKVGYSYYVESEGSTFFDRKAFTSSNDYLLLNTSDEYRGLGHSATIMGPNMDSYYIVYHSLISVNGPYRRYNLAKLNFNGTEMSVNHPELEDNLAPEMPSFSSYNGENMTDCLSNSQTSDVFTIEFNAIGNNKMYFSYVDDSNYSYIQMLDDSKDTLVLGKVTNGQNEELARQELNNNYDYTVNHTYRVSHKDGRVAVYFDNMKKIDVNLSSSLSSGKVGYQKGTTYSFIGFSNDAFDSSSQNDYKQDVIPSSTYDEKKSILDDDSFVTLTKDAGNGFEGGTGIKLHSSNQRASYKIYNFETGLYGIDLTIPTQYMGANVALRIDNEEPIHITVPNEDVNDDLLKVHVTNVELSKGSHFITLYYDGSEVTFTNISYYKTTEQKITFSNDLSSFMTKGATYVNMWKLKNNGHYALSGNRQLLYVGDDTIRDCEVEVDINFDGSTVANSAGVLLRANNPAYHTSDGDDSIQGYYAGISNGKVFIKEENYNKSLDGASDSEGSNMYESGVDHHLKVRMVGKKVDLYVDGRLMLTYSSPLGPTHGKVALYTTGAACTYKNLKVTTL